MGKALPYIKYADIVEADYSVVGEYSGCSS